MQNRKPHLALLLLLLVFLAGGAAGQISSPSQESPKTLALKTLNMDKQIYDSTFKALALLDSQGKLPAKIKSEAIRLGNLYMKAHNLAVQALLADGTANLATVRAALDLFLDVATPYMGVN